MDRTKLSAPAALPQVFLLAPPAGLNQCSTISTNVLGARSDQELGLALLAGHAGSVIVNYGSSWCAHCHELFPHFYDLAKKHPQHSYVVAQVDYMKDALQGIKVTPTFAVFKKGRKVDQFFGPSPQQLRDRVWLHSDDAQDR